MEKLPTFSKIQKDINQYTQCDWFNACLLFREKMCVCVEKTPEIKLWLSLWGTQGHGGGGYIFTASICMYSCITCVI